MQSLGVHLALPRDAVQSVLNAHFILSQSWTPIVDLDYIAGANTNEGPDSVVNTTQDFTDRFTAHFFNTYLLSTKLASTAFGLYPDDPAYCSSLDEELAAENYVFRASLEATARRMLNMDIDPYPFPPAAYCICGRGRNTPTNHSISTSSVIIPPGPKAGRSTWRRLREDLIPTRTVEVKFTASSSSTGELVWKH